jgi:hypothetical protein
MFGDFPAIVPAQFDLQFSFHPIFSFREDSEIIDGLY